MNIITNSLEQAAIFFPLVLGMYFSYRILKITDLTVDGTYVLGGAIFAKTIDFGVLPAMLFAIFGGFLVGNFVSFMQRENRINDLIAGVLASFMLYSVNLKIMQRPNISLLEKPNLLSMIEKESWLFLLCLIATVVSIFIFLVLVSRLGLFIRAFGYNRSLLSTLGKSPERYRLLGLGISNCLAALSGTLFAQVNGFADINMGFGVALIGIGAVVIGKQLIPAIVLKFSPFADICSCFAGIYIYFLCLNFMLFVGIDPASLKLALGGFLFVVLSKVKSKAYS